MVFFDDGKITIHQGDCRDVLATLPAGSIHCCVTSPPYFGLRDYGTAKWEGGDANCNHAVAEIRTGLGMAVLSEKYKGGGHKTSEPKLMLAKGACPRCGALRIDSQIGLEQSPDEYVAEMVKVFCEVKRVLHPSGTLWLNIGDSYSGSGKGRMFDGSHSETSAKQITNQGTILGRIERSYVGGDVKPKDLFGIPWLLAFALRADGWYLRQDIIWSKPNPMPESVTDRCTKAHEYIFLLSKSQKYYYNQEAIKENGGSWNGSSFTSESDFATKNRLGTTPRKKTKVPAGWKTGPGSHGTIHDEGRTQVPEYVEIDGDGKRNKRSVWNVATTPYAEAHFATFPPDLIRPCILAGCPEGGTVLDPFAGSGTTLQVAEQNGCKAVGIELNEDYCKMMLRRIKQSSLLG